MKDLKQDFEMGVANKLRHFRGVVPEIPHSAMTGTALVTPSVTDCYNRACQSFHTRFQLLQSISRINFYNRFIKHEIDKLNPFMFQFSTVE